MKQISTYLPVLSVVLIFLGYCHLHFFYCLQFDIDIYQFITTGEIILSFLPILFYLLFWTIVMGVIFVFVIVSDKGKPVEISRLKRKPYRSILWYFLWSIGCIVVAVSHFREYMGYYKPDDGYWIYYVVMLGEVLLICLLGWIERKCSSIVPHLYKNLVANIYMVFSVVIVFLYGDLVFMYSKAKEIKTGRNSDAIRFEYQGMRIDSFTDTTLSYIGSIQQYIFMYDRNTKEKFLYEKSEVRNMILNEKNPSDP